MNNNLENCPIQHLIYPLTVEEWAEVLEWFEGSKKELREKLDSWEGDVPDRREVIEEILG